MSDWLVRAYLPHEIIEGNYGPRDIKRGVECIRNVIGERIRLRRMENSCSFLVAHSSTWL